MLKIVVAYDGSEQARRALERVSWFGGGANVLVMAAVPPPPQATRLGPTDPSPPEVEEKERWLADAQAFLAAKGIEAKTLAMIGEPPDAIIDVADQEKADLIVMGTHGWSLAKRLLLGSVSTSVLHHAHCDVLVVR